MSIETTSMEHLVQKGYLQQAGDSFRPYCQNAWGYAVRVNPTLGDKFGKFSKPYKFWNPSNPPSSERTEGYIAGPQNLQAFRSVSSQKAFTFILKANGVVTIRAVDDVLELGARHSSLPDDESDAIVSSGEFRCINGTYRFNLKSATFSEAIVKIAQKKHGVPEKDAYLRLMEKTKQGLIDALQMDVEYTPVQIVDESHLPDQNLSLGSDFGDKCSKIEVYDSWQSCNMKDEALLKSRNACFMNKIPKPSVRSAVQAGFGNYWQHASKKGITWKSQSAQRTLLLEPRDLEDILEKDADGMILQAMKLLRGIEGIPEGELLDALLKMKEALQKKS
jgi:hypothetical protein